MRGLMTLQSICNIFVGIAVWLNVLDTVNQHILAGWVFICITPLSIASIIIGVAMLFIIWRKR